MRPHWAIILAHPTHLTQFSQPVQLLLILTCLVSYWNPMNADTITKDCLSEISSYSHTSSLLYSALIACLNFIYFIFDFFSFNWIWILQVSELNIFRSFWLFLFEQVQSIFYSDLTPMCHFCNIQHPVDQRTRQNVTLSSAGCSTPWAGLRVTTRCLPTVNGGKTVTLMRGVCVDEVDVMDIDGSATPWWGTLWSCWWWGTSGWPSSCTK